MSLQLQFPYQHFHDVAMNTRMTISLIDLIRHFQCNDDDELTNYDCAHCIGRQRATKTYRICHYPDILCIRIGRVRNDNSIIKNPVQYPLTGLEVNDVDESNGTAEQCVFNLIAAVNHEPATNDRGHYTAVTKHQSTNTWCEYNDDVVHRIKFLGKKNNFSSVKYQSMASILFYEIDQSRSSSHELFGRSDGSLLLNNEIDGEDNIYDDDDNNDDYIDGNNDDDNEDAIEGDDGNTDNITATKQQKCNHQETSVAVQRSKMLTRQRRPPRAMTFYERLLPRLDYEALERKRTARYYRGQDEDEDTIEEGDRAPVINTNNKMVTNATRQTSKHKHNTSDRRSESLSLNLE